ncbi:NUDIX hydrolase [Leekyejoonella antrihumi]|uniref:NUDIX domain-containing protein n=1 Tax=Leekyejoonella antrihumi TaxID=1660198 RepID=A0A563E2R0_9MICO|nr:NUDIX domain-containing protein [Leekyejoonella antrihumi]TWP36533.1 NUDIX domain-containing protein [Leekyejoonella antrihumi]
MAIDPLSPNGRTAAAGVAIFNVSGSLLLGRHEHDGRWATFGGSVEDGESTQGAALREVREEAGLELEDAELFGTFGGSPIYTVQYADGTSQSYEVTMFGHVTSGQVLPRPDVVEILECRWFTPDALTASILAPDMAEIVPAALDWFRSRGRAPDN